MKKINIEAFGPGVQIWFTIGRLKELESYLNTPIGDIMMESQKLSITNLLAMLRCGLVHQYGNKPEAFYAKLVDDALENGAELVDIQSAVIKALVGSGLLGKQYYYNVFPEEKPEDYVAKN